MKNFKRKLFIALLATFSVFTAFAGVACGNDQKDSGGNSDSSSASGEAEFMLASDRLWLNRYEEKYLEFLQGDGEGITYTVTDDKIVTVEDGKFIAQGEGETTVKLKEGSTEVTITVKVNDDGTIPMLALKDEENVCAYKDVQTTLPVYIEYGSEPYELKEYTVLSAGASAAYIEASGKTIKGVEITEEGKKVNLMVSASYKGLELEEIFAIPVREGSYIDMGRDSIDLYAGKTTLSALSIVPKAAIFRGEQLEAKDLTVTIVSGEDKIEIVKNDTTGISQVKAKVGEGTATIKISYTAADGGSVEKTMTVNLHPSHIETEYVLFDATKGASFTEVTETTGIFANREGVKKYVADPVSQQELLTSGKTSFTTAELQISNPKDSANPNRRSFENRRLVLNERSNVLGDMYRDGYRYFAYDVYIDTPVSEGALPVMPLCLYGSEYDQSFNELFYRDGVYVIQDGKITNRLAKNGWMTVVFDLYTIVYKNSSAKANFYFALNDKLATAYIDNVRYELDGEFLPNGGRPGYEATIKYSERNADGVIEVIEGCEFVPYFSNNISVEKADNEIIAKVGETGDAHESAYMFTSLTGGSWNSSALLVSSMAAGGNYAGGISQLREKGNFVAFDMYVISASKLNFRLNHYSPSITVTADSDLTEYYWIDIIDKATGKACKSFERGVWQTVVLHYNDAVYAGGWASWIALGIDNQGGQLLVDNVRYLTDFESPTEVKEEGAREQFVKTVVGGASGWSDYAVVENEPVLTFSHNERYNDNVNGWAKAGVGFNLKDYMGDKKYLKFQFKYDNFMVGGVSTKPNLYIYKDKANVFPSAWASNGIFCTDASKLPVSYADMEAGKWYTMYVEATDKQAAAGSCYLLFYQDGYADATEHPDVVSYYKNVTFVDELDMNEVFLELNPQLGVGGNLSAEYYSDGADATVKVTNATGENKWGGSGVHFKIADNVGSNSYLKFQFKFEGTKPTIFMYMEQNVSQSEWSAKGVTCYDANSAQLSYADLVADTWYTMYVLVDASKGVAGFEDDYVGFHSGGAGTVTAHVKNVTYVASDELGTKYAALKANLNPQYDAVYYMDGEDAAVKVTNGTNSSDWKGIKFIGTNTESLKYAKLEFKYDGFKPTLQIFGGEAANGTTNMTAANGYRTYYTADGAATTESELVAGQWYTLYLNLKKATTNPLILNYLNLYSSETDATSVNIHIKNFEYVATEPNEKVNELKAKVAAGSALTDVSYYMEGDEAIMSVKNAATSHDSLGWNKSAFHFLTINDSESNLNKYLKFTFKYTGITGAPSVFFNAMNTNILWEINGNADNAVAYDESNVSTLSTAMVADTWYTVYVKITKYNGSDTDNHFTCYDKGGSALTLYMKNVDIVDSLPTASV